MFLAVMLMAGSLVTASAFAAAPFPFEEITVDELLKGYASGDFTAEEVVRAYLERIAKYESKYNAFTVLNPNVLEEAREDAAIMLDVIAGYTPEDPKTVASIGNIPAGGYMYGLNVQALRGKRIGLFGPGWRDVELTAETQKLYDQAIKDLEAQGAIVVPDPFAGSGFAEAVKEYGSIGVESVIYDMQAYLERLGPDSPVKSVEELLEKTGQKPSIFNRYVDSLPDPNGTPDLSRFLEARTRLLEIFNRVMDKYELDALFFPQMVQGNAAVGQRRKHRRDHRFGNQRRRLAAGDGAGRLLRKRSAVLRGVRRQNVERSPTARVCLRLRAGDEASESAGSRRMKRVARHLSVRAGVFLPCEKNVREAGTEIVLLNLLQAVPFLF
jgi:Asp-tRNA(Asn)/Glu-tRNA(Gln) amidotransferase A subunit family amidase